MSQGKKLVTVLDSESCVPRQVAVEDVVAVSAERGEGLDRLRAVVVERLTAARWETGL